MDEYAQKWIDLAIKDHVVLKEMQDDEDSEMANQFDFCQICGDKQTGKHYGAASCDGCKGFFRRSVRKRSIYICRFDRKCVVEKDRRNQCRYCRLKKCFKLGMKSEAVQNERDKIGKQRGKPCGLDGMFSVDTLRQIEVISAANSLVLGEIPRSEQKVTFGSIGRILKCELSSAVTWAAQLPLFGDLLTLDQVNLINANVMNQFILSTVRISPRNGEGLIFTDGTFYNPNSFAKKKDELSIICDKILIEVARPLIDAQLDSEEFSCLKTMLFFDPHIDGLNQHVQERIQDARLQIQANLQDYISDQQYDNRGRFGQILLTLPSLREISLRLRARLRACGSLNETTLNEISIGLLSRVQFTRWPRGGEEPTKERRKPKKPKLSSVKKSASIDSGSESTISSPNSPNDGTAKEEPVSIKVEPDLEEYYFN